MKIITRDNMPESEKFQKMLERAEYTADKEKVAELVSIVQGLLPKIEKGMKKQLELYHTRKHKWMACPMLLKDIEKMVNKKYELISDFSWMYAETVSTEGLFLIFSAVAWRYNRITVEIGATGDHCLALWFRHGSEDSEEPSVESCAEQWPLLYQEA
jgi:hypothetical protein